MASRKERPTPSGEIETEAQQCERMAEMLRSVPGGIGEVIAYLDDRAATLKAEENLMVVTVIFDDHRSSFLINEKDFEEIKKTKSPEEAKLYLIDKCKRTEADNADYLIYADGQDDSPWEEYKSDYFSAWYGD